MAEFAEACDNTVDVIVWLRWKRGYWPQVITAYFAPYHLTYKEEYLVPSNYSRFVVEITFRFSQIFMDNVLFREEQPFRSFDDIRNFFAKYSDKRCLALMIPFRNLWFDTPERLGVAKYVHHHDSIRNVRDIARFYWIFNFFAQLAFQALAEMKVTKESLIAYHWRFGEDSCAYFASENPEMDFCWGTSGT